MQNFKKLTLGGEAPSWAALEGETFLPPPEDYFKTAERVFLDGFGMVDTCFFNPGFYFSYQKSEEGKTHYGSMDPIQMIYSTTFLEDGEKRERIFEGVVDFFGWFSDEAKRFLRNPNVLLEENVVRELEEFRRNSRVIGRRSSDMDEIKGFKEAMEAIEMYWCFGLNSLVRDGRGLDGSEETQFTEAIDKNNLMKRWGANPVDKAIINAAFMYAEQVKGQEKPVYILSRDIPLLKTGEDLGRILRERGKKEAPKVRPYFFSSNGKLIHHKIPERLKSYD